MSEILEFSNLQDRTSDATEELEESLMNILEEQGLDTKEVLFTLAKVVNEFIKMHEDFSFSNEKIDAEACFNDYLLACRDILCENPGSGIGVEGIAEC